VCSSQQEKGSGYSGRQRARLAGPYSRREARGPPGSDHGKAFSKAQVNRYKEETACVREVVTGRADAFLYDQLSISNTKKKTPTPRELY